MSRIENACNRCGRSASDIKLIAVSKTVDVEKVLEAYELGIKDFGENRVQELVKKMALLPPEINFHLIGHLQTNKVKNVVGKAITIQSVDSIGLAREINKYAERAGIICDCLIEINTSGEESKFGMKSDELKYFINETANLKNIKFSGLMTIGTFTNDELEIRRCFRELRELKEKFSNAERENLNLKELSMGMTNDFEIAIEEGATILRIGTAIFGERKYN